MSKKIAPGLCFLLFAIGLAWLATMGLGASRAEQKFHQSLLEGGRNATAHIDKTRTEPRPSGNGFYQFYDYSYEDASGQKHQGSLLKVRPRSFKDKDRVFGMDDYRIESIAVGDELAVTYMISEPATHVPAQITQEWISKERSVARAGAIPLYIFAFMLTLGAIESFRRTPTLFKIGRRDPNREPIETFMPQQTATDAITIVAPRSWFGVVFVTLWFTFWMIASVSMGACFFALLGMFAGFIIMRAVLGGTEEISIDSYGLVDKQIRLYRTSTRVYELPLISEMRIEHDHRNRGFGLVLKFRYDGAKKTLGIRSLDIPEALQIAAKLREFIPVNTEMIGEIEKRAGRLGLPEQLERQIDHKPEKKIEPPTGPHIEIVWGRSGRDTGLFLLHELAGLVPFAILAAITWLIFRGYHYRTSLMWLVGPPWYLISLAYIIVQFRMLKKWIEVGRLEKKLYLWAEIKGFFGIFWVMLLFFFIGFICWTAARTSNGEPWGGYPWAQTSSANPTADPKPDPHK